ncbi:hypothetical protein [Methylobacterium nodulans]|uniref:Uncharacterized protein n=1 Tax=Methylobacterium nodulans (strain LMG 21967 / CNCM I-2342 / ORS 2060) TaxID=460265 RepID=B8IWX4_METNO|nr:hypothetical protein [Methylobacterium nodulans]ACL63015.1 hypothetical protein Mnod_8020 [Methylobacterium nodulans ORS 2060]
MILNALALKLKRQARGTCIVAFHPNAVQDVSPRAKWKITWAESPIWTATPV